MDVFLTALLSWPTVGFTVLLGFAIVYWLMVMVGALDLHLFHHDLNVGGHGDAHGGEVHAGDHGALDHLANFLSLGAVPITIVASSFAFSGWMLCMFVALTVGASGVVPGWLLSLGLTIVAPIVALIIAGFMVRPLKALFAKAGGLQRAGTSLIGRMVRVTSVTVDATFGTAVCEIDGAELQLRIIVARPELSFRKDDQVVIVDHDQERDIYTVGPLIRESTTPAIGSDRRPPPVEPQGMPVPPVATSATEVAHESGAPPSNRPRMPQ